jgi:hypothetical protein
MLKQWDAGQPLWSWRMGGNEHHIQCMGFEILRWFLSRSRGQLPCSLTIAANLNCGSIAFAH